MTAVPKPKARPASIKVQLLVQRDLTPREFRLWDGVLLDTDPKVQVQVTWSIEEADEVVGHLSSVAEVPMSALGAFRADDPAVRREVLVQYEASREPAVKVQTNGASREQRRAAGKGKK